jgi:hypothetical protein
MLHAQDISPGAVAVSGSQLKSGSAKLSYTVGEIIVPLTQAKSGNVNQGVNGVAASSVTVRKFKDYLAQPLDVQLFPNPFSTMLQAVIGEHNFQQLEWTVFDVNGRVINREVFDGKANRISMNTMNWLPGYYFMTVSERNGRLIGTYQIIKQQ